MKFLDEYRDPDLAKKLVSRIRARATRPWHIMEICGGQTHTLIRYGIDQLLSGAVETIHGPGCPVCVTPVAKIDRAIEIAARDDVILATFGDMMRVPGSSSDLFRARASGADVRMVYSPLDAVELARENPEREIVFFAVGFETTAPANAMAIWSAAEQSLENFSAIVSHVRVPPAIRALLDAPDCRIEGFIAPGHVCTIMGFREYEELASEYRIPFVVSGFEPVDLLEAISLLVDLLEDGRSPVLNQYARSVTRDGNDAARRVMDEVFEIADMAWRGVGEIPRSGLGLRQSFARFDAERRFHVADLHAAESPLCIAGEVLRGLKKPIECPAFGKECTPELPLGAPMVSSEGACAAYYAFRGLTEVSDAV